MPGYTARPSSRLFCDLPSGCPLPGRDWGTPRAPEKSGRCAVWPACWDSGLSTWSTYNQPLPCQYEKHLIDCKQKCVEASCKAEQERRVGRLLGSGLSMCSACNKPPLSQKRGKLPQLIYQPSAHSRKAGQVGQLLRPLRLRMIHTVIHLQWRHISL